MSATRTTHARTATAALMVMLMLMVVVVGPVAAAVTMADLVLDPYAGDACGEWVAAPHVACYVSGAECAPKSMPLHTADAYTMGGAIETEHTMYIDDTRGGQGTRVATNAAGMAGLISQMTATYARLDAAAAAGTAAWSDLSRRLSGARPRDRRPLFHLALLSLRDAWPAARLASARAVVFGSMSPWVEAALLAVGVGSVTTVEYNTVAYEDPRIKSMTPSELALAVTSPDAPFVPFDLAVSLSSFDHDGLGRYADPLNPDADLQIMHALAACLLAPDAALIVSVPVGRDQLVWNLHRRYGRVRLPHLFAGWALALPGDTSATPLAAAASVLGWDDDARLDADPAFRSSYEPVFILTPVAAATRSAATHSAATRSAATRSAATRAAATHADL